MKHIRALIWAGVMCCCLTAGLAPHPAMAQNNLTSAQEQNFFNEIFAWLEQSGWNFGPRPVKSDPVNGACGAANNSSVLVKPTTNLCSTGTATALTGTGPWDWQCTGSNKGTTASCVADLAVNFPIKTVSVSPASLQAGSTIKFATSVAADQPVSNYAMTLVVISDGKTVESQKITSLSFTTKATSNSYQWTLPTAAEAGTYQVVMSLLNAKGAVEATSTTSFTVLPAPVNGACGSDNGLLSLPFAMANLCSSGKASGVTGSGNGPLTWSCAGLNGGTSASCIATPPKACIDANHVSHASGSTYTLQLSQTTGSLAATPAQCAYGGTQATTITTDQTYICTNGIQTAQGAAKITTANTGSPVCKAAAACGSTPSGSTVTNTVSTTNGSIAATIAQCTYGGTVPTKTTVTQVSLCTNGTLSAQGAPVTTTVASGSPSCKAAPVVGVCGSSNGSLTTSKPATNLCASGTVSAVSGTGPWTWGCAGANGGATASCSASLPKVCVDAKGASHASGSSYTLQLSQTASSIAATTAQCTYGGTQATTVTTSQTYSCSNGVQTMVGAPQVTSVASGSAVCKAAAACGATPSGSTVTNLVSTTTGSVAATAAQCSYGGTQTITTSVTQASLCTNGTLTAQGAPITTTVINGNPECKVPVACGGTPSGSTVTNVLSLTTGSIAATAAQCSYGGTQTTTTTVTQVSLCTNGTLTKQGSPVSKTVIAGTPTCYASSTATGHTPQVYYVSASGNDTNAGTTPATAFRTIARLDSEKFGPGDTIYFAGGQTFNGSLDFRRVTSGTASAPITVTSYGAGTATIASGFSYGLYVQNAAGFKIENLNFVGSGPELNHQNGIFFTNNLEGNVKLSYIYIDHVNVSGFGVNGIAIGGDNGTSGFNDVTITNATVHDNMNGVYIFSDANVLSAGSYANSNVYIGYTTAYNNLGDTSVQVTGNGITMSFVDHGTIEYSEAYNNGGNITNSAGPVGIWAFQSNDVTIQSNESHDNHTQGGDGDGFDFDGGETNSVMQYNYSHNNDGAGILLCEFNGASPNTGNIVRFNISQNDARRDRGFGAILVYSKVSDTEVYNNTVYMSTAAGNPSAVVLMDWSGSNLHFRNNIFMTDGVPFVSGNTGSGLLFQGNDYWNTASGFKVTLSGKTYTSLAQFQAAGQETLVDHSLTGLNVNPMLFAAGAGDTVGNPTLLANLTAYEFEPKSPMLNTGLNLQALFGLNAGGRDYYNYSLDATGALNIGAE